MKENILYRAIVASGNGSAGGAPAPSGTKKVSITENGTTTENVSGFANAEIAVNVLPKGTKKFTITENGTVNKNVSGFANAEISVNVPETVTDEKFLAFFNDTIVDFNDESIVNVPSSACHSKSFESVSLPNCEYVGMSAFERCSFLTTVDLPKCTNVDTNAFNGCFYLETVNLPECKSLQSSSMVFQDCQALTTVHLPKCTWIGQFFFAMCSSLVNIKLESCKAIEGFAFMMCSALETVILPKCEMINGSPFSECPMLTSIVLSNNKVVTLYDSLGGSDDTFSTTSIYVPDDLVEDYKTATNWITYATQIKPLSTYNATESEV